MATDPEQRPTAAAALECINRLLQEGGLLLSAESAAATVTPDQAPPRYLCLLL